MELWKDVIGYEGLYQVSNLGRIKAMPKRGHKSQIMKSSLKKDGYNRILLSKNAKYKTLYVHRLVAEAFLEHSPEQCEVNHIDGDKTNNNVTNLEWVTKNQNQKHAISLGLRQTSPMTGRKGGLAPLARPIYQCNTEGKILKEWCCIKDAALFLNCSPSCISNVLSGKCKTSRGYIWKYK